MIWPFRTKEERTYWLKVFAGYILAETVVQLVFFFIFNSFTQQEGSRWEYHGLMVLFHAVLIWPIWWVARMVRKKPLAVQILVNTGFAFLYGYAWFGPVQELFASVYNKVLEISRPGTAPISRTVDSYMSFSVVNFQVLKHAFRLTWYYLAEYWYHYREEEQKRIELALSNRDLQLKLLKWHLNPSFYFRTVKFLQASAAVKPSQAGGPILQLARIMEYVIYEARQPQVDIHKEMDFLFNYVDLLNSQSDPGKVITLVFQPADEPARITPLLLVALIDAVMLQSGDNGCRVTVRGTGNDLEVNVPGIRRSPLTLPVLEEFYRDRYTESFTVRDGYRLKLKLNAG